MDNATGRSNATLLPPAAHCQDQTSNSLCALCHALSNAHLSLLRMLSSMFACGCMIGKCVLCLQAACVLWMLPQPLQADGQVRGAGESVAQGAHSHLCQHRCGAVSHLCTVNNAPLQLCHSRQTCCTLRDWSDGSCSWHHVEVAIGARFDVLCAELGVAVVWRVSVILAWTMGLLFSCLTPL